MASAAILDFTPTSAITEPVLVVSRDRAQGVGTREVLAASGGFSCVVVSSLSEARNRLSEEAYGVVLIDAALPFVGLLLGILREQRPFPAIFVTGALDVKSAFVYSRLGVRGQLARVESAAQLRVEIERSTREIPSLEATCAAHVGRTELLTLLGQARSMMFEQAVAMEAGSRSGAARLLGVSRQAVQQWSATELP